MPDKKLGHKAVITVDGTAIGCVRNFTPPEKSREEVQVTCMGDAIEEYLDSDPPNQGMLMLDVVWEPGDTNSALLDTLFDATDPDDREAAFTIAWNMFSPVPTDAFSGRILNLTPAQVESKTVISRQVQIRLTTAITRTIAGA